MKSRKALFSVFAIFFPILSSSAIIQDAPVLSETIVQNTFSMAYCPQKQPGEICLMTEQNAELYCESQNSHLPTTREFARYSVAHEALGILEVSEVESKFLGKAPAGYYRVDNQNPGNQLDSFYFNHQGYNAASGNLGQLQYWTASVVPGHTDYAHVFYGAWGGGGGNPQEHKRTFLNAVRCLKNL